MKAIYIEWVDSSVVRGWQSQEGLPAAMAIARCATIGFYVSEDKNVLALALNASVDGKCSPFGEVVSIPKAAITKRKAIKI